MQAHMPFRVIAMTEVRTKQPGTQYIQKSEAVQSIRSDAGLSAPKIFPIALS